MQMMGNSISVGRRWGGGGFLIRVRHSTQDGEKDVKAEREREEEGREREREVQRGAGNALQG